ncbi:MAG TPA: dihydrofolate reductase [Bacteroidales bacterium]|nr:dihydrofolate reductase [Bacteroidales bacterium]
MISIIVAVAENSAIGKNNELLWHIPEDLKRFKRITSGHPVIMGKRTWESLPVKPLPGRHNIVLTDVPNDRFAGATVVFSVPEAVALCPAGEECFVIGGASVYAQFLPLADRIYLTRVNREFEGDVFFPQINEREWKLVSEEPGGAMGDGCTFSYRILERIPGAAK